MQIIIIIILSIQFNAIAAQYDKAIEIIFRKKIKMDCGFSPICEVGIQDTFILLVFN